MKLKYKIKIPNTVNIFYSTKKNILIIKGPLRQRSLKLKIKVIISQVNKSIVLTTIPSFKIANNKKKQLKAICGATFTQLKTLIAETNTTIYKKLNIVGVGYRVFTVDSYENNLLLFKLGYSHPVYFKIPENLTIFHLKNTRLFVYGNSYQSIVLTSSLIKKNKLPEPYKGKGILYDKEKIQLKQGKKV